MIDRRNARIGVGLAVFFVPLVFGAPQTEAQTPTIREWQVPWETSRPRDPYVGPAGKVWFVGQASDYVASFDPANGEFTRFDLAAGTGPHNLIVGDDGIVWYAGNRAAHIGRLDPATGEIEKIPMPDAGARDPHTLVFDRAGNIWFTVQRGGFVGRMNMASRHVDLVRVPADRSRPYGIALDPDGQPWIAEFGTNKIATIDPESLELREFELPRANTRPRRLVLDSNRSVWYVDYRGGFVGQLDPSTGAVEEWASPRDSLSLPYGMVIDDEDRIWYAETNQPNRIVAFDTRSKTFLSSTDVPSGGLSIRNMFYHAPTRSIWFGTDANTIGKVSIGRD